MSAALVVVYVNEDRTGTTFALEPQTRRMLETQFAARPVPRIFIGSETRQTFEHVLRPVLLILTGIAEERLHELGSVEFREPVTERVLHRV